MIRVISSLVAHVLLTAALLAPARAAEVSSVLNICNVGNTTLFVVVVGQTRRTSTIDGWQQVDVGSCGSAIVSFHGIVGFAIVNAKGQKGMQVYDGLPGLDPAFIPTGNEYCVFPDRNFHQESAKPSCICKPGEVLARFAFHVKPKTNAVLTLRIPADRNGEIFPLVKPAALPPFDPTTWIPTPEASFQIAMRGLAEQQERLGFRIERNDPPPAITWHAYYIRELGAVVRPETHVASIAKDSPADKAGFRRGDEITELNGMQIKSAWHVRGLLVRMRPGETHTIAFMRSDRRHEAKVTLAALPAKLAASDLHPEQGWLGIEFESAARVVGVIYREGTAHLEPGDDVQKIGRTDFDGVDGLAEWLARNQETATVELQVSRRSVGKILVMTLHKLD